MKRFTTAFLLAFCFGILLTQVIGQTAPTGTVTVNTSIVAQATNGTNVLTCTISPQSAARLQFGFNCSRSLAGAVTTVPGQVFDVSIGGESITYQINLDGNAVALILTQSTPTGTPTYQVVANGTAKPGSF